MEFWVYGSEMNETLPQKFIAGNQRGQVEMAQGGGSNDSGKPNVLSECSAISRRPDGGSKCSFYTHFPQSALNSEQQFRARYR